MNSFIGMSIDFSLSELPLLLYDWEELLEFDLSATAAKDETYYYTRPLIYKRLA